LEDVLIREIKLKGILTMTKSLPLEGLRVLDLTTVIMGPFTTQVLGDFGADIIKVEEPNGDMTRDIGPSRSDKMSSMFLGVNRNKRSIVLNLKKAFCKKSAMEVNRRSGCNCS
jgi:crotonobetainyl-CoA:carnitine CoA-transferase CaiB-like acyl-CoA transferase